MRNVANFKDQKLALKFWNFLQSEGIESTLEEDDPRSMWSIWVVEEEKLKTALSLYEIYIKDPENTKFDTSRVDTVQAGSDEKFLKKKTRFKSHNLSETWRKQEKSPGMISLSLIIVSVAVYLLSAGGKNYDVVKYFLFTTGESRGFPEILSGEIWRVLTPIFLHSTILHILFNMYWLYLFGGQIEKKKGSPFIAIFIFVTAIISNFAEAFLGNNTFGGMSGVVYGLFGYIWIKSKFDLGDGLFIEETTAMLLLGWFFLCFANIIPGVANWAHAGGLITGTIWGYISAIRWNRVS